MFWPLAALPLAISAQASPERTLPPLSTPALEAPVTPAPALPLSPAALPAATAPATSRPAQAPAAQADGAAAETPAAALSVEGRRMFDGGAPASGDPSEDPAAEPPAAPRLRYEKLHEALERYLAKKGYGRALAAMAFARSKHTGKRKDGLTPEFQHQVEIALYITTLKGVRDEELALTAAMLHDVVEDYPVSREEIRDRFGADVEDVVWRLTKVYRGEHKPYPEYFAAIAADPTASLVKGADRVNNLQTMIGAFTLEKQHEYADEAVRWFLPMLKRARRRFPDQADAYFNVEQRLKSQLELIRAMLEQADRAAGVSPALRAAARQLAAQAPGARLDFNAERGYLYANRERIADADGFFGRAVQKLRAAAGERGLAVLDTTFPVPGDDLFARNVVDAAAVERLAEELGPGADYEAMTPQQRARLLFDPLARRLEAEPGPLLLHLDHHYSPDVLASASTTPMVVDFLRYLRSSGRYSLLQRLQRTLAVLDHSDADIALSHLALRHAAEPAFLDRYGDLLRAAALFNDYVREIAPDETSRGRARVLYNVAAAVQDRVAGGALRYSQALDLLAAAARWAAGLEASGGDFEADVLRSFDFEPPRSAVEAALRELFGAGYSDYERERAALARMADAGVDQGPASTMRPGTMRRDGPVLLVYADADAKYLSTASIVRYLRTERPEVLAGVRVVVAATEKDGGRFFKMRSFTGPDGRYLNLARPKDGLYARFNARRGPGGKPYEASGRHFAGGGAKGGFGPLTADEVRRVLGDLADAAKEAAAAQALP